MWTTSDGGGGGCLQSTAHQETKFVWRFGRPYWTPPCTRASGSQYIVRFGRFSRYTLRTSETGVPNGRCWTGVGVSKKSVFASMSLMDDPLGLIIRLGFITYQIIILSTLRLDNSYRYSEPLI